MMYKMLTQGGSGTLTHAEWRGRWLAWAKRVGITNIPKEDLLNPNHGGSASRVALWNYTSLGIRSQHLVCCWIQADFPREHILHETSVSINVFPLRVILRQLSLQLGETVLHLSMGSGYTQQQLWEMTFLTISIQYCLEFNQYRKTRKNYE